MKKYIYVNLVKLVALTAMLLTSSSLLAIDRNFLSDLKNKISEQGQISVLVQISSPEIEGLLSSQNLSDSQRLDVVKYAQLQLKQSLNINPDVILHDYTYSPLTLINVDSQLLDLLSTSPLVKQIHENIWLKPALSESVGLSFSTQAISEYTGDNQWAVAVLDTGVDKNHSFLQTGNVQKVISEACYSGAQSVNPAIVLLCPGNSFSSIALNSGLNCSGFSGCAHGTHVAGIAVGDGIDFDGMAKLGKIIAIQVFTGFNDTNICGSSGCLLSATSDLIQGLERVYALRNTYKIAAVNMSLGGGQHSGECPDNSIAPIINLLKNAGIATVIASGNGGYNSSISSPACIPDAIAVGSSYDSGSEIDKRALYSNNSSVLDLYAPGSYITSSVPGGGFSTYVGTSMATPHVAGAWAVLKHAKPDATVAEIEAILKSVGPLITSSGISRTRLDVTAALHKLVVNSPPTGSSIIPILQLLLLPD